MKSINILLIVLMAMIFASCKKTEEPTVNPPIVTAEWLMVQAFENDNQIIETYTKSGSFHTGYNDIMIKIKDNSNDYLEGVELTWMPIMTMPNMTHSCPKSNLSVDGESYSGYLVFQMTGMEGAGWNLKFDYTIDGVVYSVDEDITVIQSPRQNVATFMGTDSVRYILALIDPVAPEIAINEMTVGLFTMQNMMMFPVVEDFSITLDPRMPSMGNHTSPNNTDLTYSAEDHMYHGDLSLTMTGYWVLNHKLLNAEGVVLKGEDVTETNPQSSLYLELEF